VTLEDEERLTEGEGHVKENDNNMNETETAKCSAAVFNELDKLEAVLYYRSHTKS